MPCSPDNLLGLKRSFAIALQWQTNGGWKKKKREGKIDKCSSPRQLSSASEQYRGCSAGGSGFHGGAWLFCKINNLENRFLRFGAHMSTWAEDIHPLKTMSPSRLSPKNNNKHCDCVFSFLYIASGTVSFNPAGLFSPPDAMSCLSRC